MNAFEIVGGKPLKGEIIPQGAKNEALQIAELNMIKDTTVEMENIPNMLM